MKSINIILWPFRQFFKLIFLLACSIAASMLINSINEASEKKRNFKKRLKYFNPVIKKTAFGERLEWIGRDRPLNDQELKNLL